MAKKTVVFYGKNGDAAKKKHPEVDQDSYQLIQADAYQGERLEADEMEFADDVPAGEQERIRKLWGKFDNRQNMEKAGGPTSLGGVERTPAADRRNLNPATRVDDPEKVKENQIDKRPGVAPATGDNAERQDLGDHKGVGLDQTTGNKATDRNKIPR